MTAKEAVIWLINISADIGKSEYRSLWHYEQALDEIRDLLESMPIEPEPSQVARDIAAIIQNEKDMRVIAQRWIPCSEKMPEKGGYYLVTCGDDVRSQEVDCYDHGNNRFVFYNVIAWMPLPEPYREDKE